MEYPEIARNELTSLHTSISKVLFLWSSVFCSDTNQNEIAEYTVYRQHTLWSFSLYPHGIILLEENKLKALMFLYCGVYFIIFHCLLNVIIIEINFPINILTLSYLKITFLTTFICGNIVFFETSPWCQKFGDYCVRMILFIVPLTPGIICIDYY